MIELTTAADANYAPHVGAMLHSAFSATPGEPMRVHFLHRPGFDAAEAGRLQRLCAAHGAQFEAVEVDPAWLEDLPVGGWYVQEAWYRVFMPRILPAVDRVLWLDADTIVRSSLKPLWETPLQGKSLAAVPNAVLHAAADTVARLGIADRRQYFNTGVLLLDLARMRAEESESRLRAAAAAKREWIRFADQDVLNCVYHGNFVRLPLAWNVLTHSYINVPETLRVHGADEFREAMREPRILHFTGRLAKKPWSYRCSHPHRDLYLRHRAAAGWPPPADPDRSLGARIVRHTPLRLREIASSLRHARVREALSYVAPW